MENITSAKNSKVLLWRSLRDRKGRLSAGCFLVEGQKMVGEALLSRFAVECIIGTADKLESADVPSGINVYCLPEALFASVCDTKTPQGIAAVLRLPTETTISGQRLVALDGVQDPGNIGTILRTADAAGFQGIFLSGECADIYSPKVLRATMGSIFRMPCLQTKDLPHDLAALRDKGYALLSSQLDGEPFYRRSPIGEQYVLIVGNEGNGISEPVKQIATHRLKLPMRGGAESLNAAVAAGIMMYELTKDLPEA